MGVKFYARGANIIFRHCIGVKCGLYAYCDEKDYYYL